MKNFLSDDFMLESPTACDIYASIKDLPIIDYHCHLSAQEIYENKPYQSITDVWLGADHYKWRAMRNMGVDEQYITGDSDPYQKFVAWATVLPYMAGHPLYTFSAMELKNYFGITDPLNANSAQRVYDEANKKLGSLTPRKIIELSNVETIITTNDPIEDLTYHAKLAEEGYPVKVLPAFRPDRALGIEKDDFVNYIQELSSVANTGITTITKLKFALNKRLGEFCAHGCVAADHGLDTAVYTPVTAIEADKIFKKALAGEPLTTDEINGYKTHMLTFLSLEYAKRDIAMEIHFGCFRNVNSEALGKLGKDTGFDCMRSFTGADALYPLLNAINDHCAANYRNMPRTILFSLNPADNDVLVTMMGAFNQSNLKGRVQQGCAWWFNDNKQGIERQIATYAAGAPIDTFLGMLTDSRSLLSYARHEFFRRILANFLGGLIERGEYPQSELPTLREIAADISCYNAKKYFGVPND